MFFLLFVFSPPLPPPPPVFSFSIAVAASPQCSCGLIFPSLQEGCCWCGEAGHKILLFSIVALLVASGLRHHWPRALGTPWHLSPCLYLISQIFPYFPDVSSSQDLFLLLGPPSLRYPHLLASALLSGNQASRFSSPNSLRAEAEWIMSL